MQVVGVINSFNRSELLRFALPSLASALKGSRLPGAIVVFDAGSTDGSREFISEFSKASAEVPIRSVFCRLGEPNSFSDGINRATAAAISEFPSLRWFLLFETDNLMEDHRPLDDAISFAEAHPDVGAVGFTTRLLSGKPAGCGCRFPTAFEFLIGLRLATLFHLDRSEGAVIEASEGRRAFECDAVYTSPLVIRREAWAKNGGLDAGRFPFSDCDVDWAWRLRKLGWRQLVLRTEKVVHDNRDIVSVWSKNRAIHFHRGRLRLLRLHRGTPALPLKLGLAMRHLGELLVCSVLFYPRRRHLPRLRARGSLLRTVFRGYEG